jgi:DNA polymerase III delta prime subunit
VVNDFYPTYIRTTKFSKEQRDARQLFAGKGIKFVREDLKNFAKSNINTSHGIFKSVVLYNADYLTIDAQPRYGGV